MYRTYIIIILGFVSVLCKSQSIVTERVYFCINQPVYHINDSIHVEGLILNSDSTKRPESQYVNLEIFDKDGVLCVSYKLRCYKDGAFVFNFPTDAIMKKGMMTMRAYTRWMKNLPSESFPSIPFSIEMSQRTSSNTSFNWQCSSDDIESLFHDVSLPEKIDTAYIPEKELEISGKAVYFDGHNVVKNGSVLIFQKSNNNVYTGLTDSEGHFCIAVEDFSSDEEFYFQAYDQKGREYHCIFYLDEESIPPFKMSKENEYESRNEDRKTNNTINNFGFDKVNALPQVTVRPKQKTLAQEQHKTNPFNLLTHQDLVEHNYQDFRDVISYFSQHMTLGMKGSGDYELSSHRLSLLGKPTPVKIVLDGIEISPNECMNNFTIHDFESIEYVEPNRTIGIRGLRNALGGALVIKTRIGKSKEEYVSSKGQIFILRGISNINK